MYADYFLIKEVAWGDVRKKKEERKKKKEGKERKNGGRLPLRSSKRGVDAANSRKGSNGIFLRDFWIPRNFIVARRGPFPPWNFLTSSKKKNPSSLIGLVHPGIRIQLYSPHFFSVVKNFHFYLFFPRRKKFVI